MNKAQLVDALAERLGDDRRRAAATVEAVVDTIYRTVQKGEKVAITGFGVFEKRERAARTARNPATGEPVKVKKTSVPAFRAGREFKDVVGGSKKLPKATAGPTAKSAAAPAGKRAGAGTGPATKVTARSTTAASKTSTAKAPAKATTSAAAKATAAKATAEKAPAKSTAGKATKAAGGAKGAAKKAKR